MNIGFADKFRFAKKSKGVMSPESGQFRASAAPRPLAADTVRGQKVVTSTPQPTGGSFHSSEVDLDSATSNGKIQLIASYHGPDEDQEPTTSNGNTQLLPSEGLSTQTPNKRGKMGHALSLKKFKNVGHMVVDVDRVGNEIEEVKSRKQIAADLMIDTHKLNESVRDQGSIMWPVLAMLFLPPFLSWVPIAIPFGNPFGGSIMENWAYYFVYNTWGWFGMWMKVTLWNCSIWKQPFFLPWMLKSTAGEYKDHWIVINGSFWSVNLSLVFSTGLFLLGAVIFKNNPVPIGTIFFGVPCFGVQFLLVYVFLIPAKRKKTLAGHVGIIKVLMSFVIFVLGLCAFISLTWVQYQLVEVMDEGCVVADPSTPSTQIDSDLCRY
jgi:hypothetical protein